MDDPFSAFLDEPDEGSLRALRSAIIDLPGYGFLDTDVLELDQLVMEQRYAVVAGFVQGLMPAWLLSPRVHALASLAAEALGDDALARRERAMARACILGIKRSGDGSRNAPFPVTHISDEHDLAEHMGLEVLSQSRGTAPCGLCDVLTCADGTELWFDIDAPMQNSL